MTYTIKKLAELAGISTRTLRYYDEIQLLKPKRMETSEYRIYEEAEVDRLQQILFYREMGFELSVIKEILDAESFEQMTALKSHLLELQKKRNRLDLLIENVTKTIQKEEGARKMSDQEKFQGFKEELIRKNEEKYGEEIRSKYGEETVKASNAKMMNLSESEYQRMTSLDTEISKYLQAAVLSGADPKGEEGKKATMLHKEWLSISMPNYTPEIHRGLAEMYVADERFTKYYDKEIAGCAKFLRDAIVENMN
ncbi:MAG: MerR family transcriptional regulator [Lachnospiraceae bacterium]|nr:MerR family transcriptional regulator [Lachnospiraceae bacterium]MDD3617019.1 MerR family transcriptional regulator [Lachnospiraceae bacterium]